MDRGLIGILKEWFTNYADHFKSRDEDLRRNIILKEEHSKRVCKEILYLGKRLHLSKEDLLLAEVAALFHDVGRFEQYAQYRTYADRRSVDHAELGVRILQDQGVLEELEKPQRDLVLRAISYHNRASLRQDETDSCLFLSRLLRDADKLDILYLLTEHYRMRGNGEGNVVELDLPEAPDVSEEVYQDLMAKRVVSYAELKTATDFRVLQMGWVYDVNFVPTLCRLQRRGYLEMLRDAVPRSERIEEIFSSAKSYVRERTQRRRVRR